MRATGTQAWRLVQQTADAVTLILLAPLGLLLFVLTVVGIVVLPVWLVSMPLLLLTLALTRPYADLHRGFAARTLGVAVPPPYRTREPGGALRQLGRAARDPARWRDLAWLPVNGTVGVVLYLVGLVESLLHQILAPLPGPYALELAARCNRRFLGSSQQARLARRVAELTRSRAAAVDIQAAELRRIERDLHDGAQARLVALGMTLGIAEQSLEQDPERMRRILGQARDELSAALGELRGLVRGMHPPVLADRGLVGALEALVLASPLPVSVDIALPGRPSAPIESAVYFGAAEALTNVIKHSDAHRADLLLRHQAGVLVLRLTDDGHGGADLDAGSGLRGIQRRLATFDGTLSVDSPDGGPTEVVLEVPCALSSPRTSPSSARA
ncbi:MAG TPA: sensor domain-containing protein [Mycobacteriales bacterium]|nr:sensor domain-containing protein [Mycobacteriales bacterium]